MLYEVITFLRRDFSCLSGGEQQRVLLAKTLLQIWPDTNPDAKLLMLDEPLAGLDFYHQLQLLDLLKEITSHGLTVISSIHDFNLAITHTDFICCLEQGKLKFADQASAFNDVITSYSIHYTKLYDWFSNRIRCNDLQHQTNYFRISQCETATQPSQRKTF